jgi:hypothetical protein
VTEEQVLFFRARRGHLAGPGAPTPKAAARAIVGAQAQQLPPALLGLSLRTKGRPTAAAVTAKLMTAPRTLVRTWGQRDTLFLYDPADWAKVVAARAEWAPGGRGGPMPSEATLVKARALMAAAPGPVTRTDLLPIAPASYARAVAARAKAAGMDAKRLAAARLVWRLAQEGDACLGPNAGSERTYATRAAWFPKLDWPAARPDAVTAAAALTLRYLAVHGPATATDIGHFFGARVANVRRWLETIAGELTDVRCDGRTGLLARTADLRDLRAKPPTGATAWPLRLLPLWEAMLMAHADKTWTVPDEADRKLVWRKAAFVAAVALDRGRAVATWTQTKRGRRLAVEVEPLSAWRKTRHAAGVKREAAEVAAHLGLEGADVTLPR